MALLALPDLWLYFLVLPGVSFASRRLGKTDVLSGGVKDGVVLPDEDVAQDPQLLRAAPPEPGHAFVVALAGGK